jgi:YidC/Oxa1 family membrane protein insertase
VLLYWLTTNFWSMGQQAVVIKRMDAKAAVAGAAGSAGGGPAGPAPGAKPVRAAGAPALADSPATGTGTDAPPPATPPKPAAPKPAGNRRPANRSKKRKGRGRR